MHIVKHETPTNVCIVVIEHVMKCRHMFALSMYDETKERLQYACSGTPAHVFALHVVEH